MAGGGAKEGFETLTDIAAVVGNPFDRSEHLERFSMLIEPGKTVLDVGCGDGLPVDEYLVNRGFAVNGIDASARMIELATTNVPGAFYEVKDMFDLQEGEYCVDGVVSLRAMLHIPRAKYRTLLTHFASFMPNGGALLLAMRPDEGKHAGEAAHSARSPWDQDDAGDNTAEVEDVGFTIILNEIDALGDANRQTILAHS